MMKLVDEGRLEVVDAAIEHLPEFQLVNYAKLLDTILNMFMKSYAFPIHKLKASNLCYARPCSSS